MTKKLIASALALFVLSGTSAALACDRDTSAQNQSSEKKPAAAAKAKAGKKTARTPPKANTANKT